jgi:hypothetical protein
MAAMQSHLPYVTDYANAARRAGTVDVMVKPAVADIPILAFGRYAEIVRAAGLSLHSRGVSYWLHGPYWLSSTSVRYHAPY